MVRSFGGFADFALETGVGSHEAGVAGIDAGFGRGGDHRVSFVAPDSGRGGWWRQNERKEPARRRRYKRRRKTPGMGDPAPVLEAGFLAILFDVFGELNEMRSLAD